MSWVAVDGLLVGVFAVADAPRPEAAEAVRALRSAKLTVKLPCDTRLQSRQPDAKVLGSLWFRIKSFSGGIFADSHAQAGMALWGY